MPKNEKIVKIKARPLHTGQQHVADTESRFNVLACGRRFGKTEYGKDRLYKKLWVPNRKVAWLSPTYRMMGEVWRSVKRKLSPAILDSNAAEHRFELHNHSTLDMWSLDNYEAIRGRKYHLVIVDEAAVVRNLKDAWQAAIRATLVDYKGQAYFLSTPRGDNFFKELFDMGWANDEWASWQMPTATNPYIDAGEIEAMRVEMSSRLYEQEIMARFIADLEGALWTRILLDEYRTKKVPDYLQRIVVSIDPGINADSQGETGIVVTGLDYDDHCHVLEDCTIRATPEGWAKQAISAYERWEADRIVVERNQGGDMVAATLRTIDATVPIMEVHASRGKVTRAEPVVALYEQGMVHHVGFFPGLENQLCGWVPGDPSPDRLDALVWGVWALKLSDEMKKVAQVRVGRKGVNR